VPVRLDAGAEGCSANFYGTVDYASKEQGIHLYIYDTKTKSVLTEKCFTMNAE